MIEIKKNCLNCGKEFFKGKINNNWKTYKIDMPLKFWERKKYCSKKCGKIYQGKRSYKKNILNRKEYAKNYNKQLTKEKRKQYYENGKEKRKQYYEKNKEKILNYTKERLKKFRKSIFEKFNNKCVVCGFKEVLDIHHINGRKNKNDWSKKNEYIVLCPNHHIMLHRKMLKEQEDYLEGEEDGTV